MARRKIITTLAVIALCGVPGTGGAVEGMPLTLSGSVGAGVRLFEGSDDQRSLATQTLASLHGSALIWRPWFGNGDFNMTVALNQSSTANELTQEDDAADSSVVTGGFNINLLPRTRAPFTLSYSLSDTRIDNDAVNGDALIILGDGDATTRHIGLRQSFITDRGYRFRGRYDNSKWSSERGGDYDNEIIGFDFDLHEANNDLRFNARLEESSRSTANQTNQSALFDITHYYTPRAGLRIDTRASSYDIERGFDVPGSTQSGTSFTDIRQLSSFVFWRPRDQKLSVSGGARIFSMDGANVSANNEAASVSVSTGLFYRFNKALRFDGSVNYTKTDSNGSTTDVHRENIGYLYQSDLIPLFEVPAQSYRWFSSGSLTNSGDEQGSRQVYTVSIGHRAQRVWATGSRSRLRGSIGQTLNESYDSRAEQLVHRVDQTLSLGWSQSAPRSSSSFRLSVNDSRNLGDDRADRQLVNFQLSRDQRISRRSSLTGNITIQSVRQNFLDDVQDGIVTTTTANLVYRSIALFGVPRLSFNSSLLAAVASDDQGEDRVEWGNRLDYRIGQLTAYFSVRYLEYDDRSFTISYLRLERRF